MPAAYSFVSRWRVNASADRVWREIEGMLRPGAARAWWPGVTLPLAPRRLVPGERLVLQVRSPLGYDLRMRLQLTDIQPGRAIGALSDGDLRGSGRLTVEKDGEAASVTVLWQVETRRAWMNATAWLLRPAFERAHAHVMRRGEAGLRAAVGAGGSEPRNAGNPRFRAESAVGTDYR
ncbi:hypothetical protein [Microbacterium jejuense]|uniref:hypothetical protein n=1 Tax=Microbacterium jejuense TaxID=1263637 RepID=UPI0031EA5382